MTRSIIKLKNKEIYILYIQHTVKFLKGKQNSNFGSTRII